MQFLLDNSHWKQMAVLTVSAMLFLANFFQFLKLANLVKPLHPFLQTRPPIYVITLIKKVDVPTLDLGSLELNEMR